MATVKIQHTNGTPAKIGLKLAKDTTMTQTETLPLRLPKSLKKAIELQSKKDGTSVNQFIAMAVAEKLSALQTAEFFADRRNRADFQAFDKLMRRKGGQRARAGDEAK